MTRTDDTAILYSAVLRPHRSGGVRGARVVTLILAFLLAAIGVSFVLAGAWPILPFLGLEVVLLYAALRYNQRSGNAEEAINLTRRALTVRRTDHWGKQSSFSFSPHWLQVNLLPLPGNDNRLELRSQGRSLAIANFLTPDERKTLAVTLRRMLGRLTLPSVSPASAA